MSTQTKAKAMVAVVTALHDDPVEALKTQLEDLIKPTPSTTESKREKEVRDDPDFSLTDTSFGTEESDEEESPSVRRTRVLDLRRTRKQ